MKKFYKVLLLVFILLTLTGTLALAQGQVGADCTDPPNLVPFADLVNCDLSGMDMSGINIWAADLSGANISDANLSGALLEGVDFTGANATGAIFDNADLFTTILVGATFDGASLRNTNMEDAYAPGGSSFINADFRGADLYFADFRDANISGANFSGNYINSFDLPRAIAQNADFSGATMTFMNMRDTDLRGADLSGASLGHMSFHNADFRDATLLGAEQSSGVHFDDVIWGNTTCADGSNSDDNDGDNFTCEGNFPENLPPTITLTSPADGASVPFGEPITISGEAADPDGSISRVEIYGDGAFLAYVSASFSYEWTNVSAGSHEIYAIAFDDNGVFAGESASTQSETVTITVEPPANNQPPTVEITSPSDGQKVYRWWGTDFEADAADADGNVIKVEFYSGSTLLHTDTHAPYGFWWRPDSRGSHILTAKAYDDGGAVTTSDPVTIRAR
ncbi:MAG: pentapeptide repeat-containing protein [Candidatus Promineifilaceae bacterium]|nr:pentapeptide repeat-containing protein [Candidatus Promineifilaceae bacterium]